MAVQNKCNITTLITGNHREKLPNNRKSAIYSIDGQDGNMVCIGQTKRNIEIGLKEHLWNIRLYQIGKPVLAAHVCDRGHIYFKLKN